MVQAPPAVPAIPTPAAEPRRGSWAVAEPDVAPVPAEASGFAVPEPFVDAGPAAAFPSPRTAPPTDRYEEDDEPVPVRYPYTWLHLIVLAVVAFVLGFLVFVLWSHGRQTGTSGAEGPSGVPVVVAAQATVRADHTIAS